MTACIGWPADPPCPVHGQFHGCQHPDGHPNGTGHVCACGARSKAPKARKFPATDGRSCGTNAGYVRHRRRGETPCQACKTAHTSYQQARAATRPT